MINLRKKNNKNYNKKDNIMQPVHLFLLLIIVLIVGPLLTIWALNTIILAMNPELHAIPYTFWTWAAAALLTAAVGARTK